MNITVYKKSKGCPNCAVLDRLIPTLQKKFPELVWNFVVIDPDSNDNPAVPSFVKSFPTSVVSEGDVQLGVFTGYDLGKSLHGILNATT